MEGDRTNESHNLRRLTPEILVRKVTTRDEHLASFTRHRSPEQRLLAATQTPTCTHSSLPTHSSPHVGRHTTTTCTRQKTKCQRLLVAMQLPRALDPSPPTHPSPTLSMVSMMNCLSDCTHLWSSATLSSSSQIFSPQMSAQC